MILLSLASVLVLCVPKVYPLWGEATWKPKFNLPTTSYRPVFGGVGGQGTARLRHIRR